MMIPIATRSRIAANPLRSKALTIKQHTLDIGRIACFSVSSPATDSKHDRDQRLQDESQASGTLKPLWQVIQELSGKNIDAAGLDGFPDGQRQRNENHQSCDHRNDCPARNLHL
jgi:hypothetical protein